ncbi:MAG: ribosome-associated translation inhibitor RaiA [Clostridiales bacterium]|jgi:putative sigma-54 modulation protein|nr:ribosome-associated translation inhibitor RaiA [Clostridiales bacterium]
MRIEITCKNNYTAGEKLKEIVAKKVERLGKYFDGDPLAKVNLGENAAKKSYTMEITIKTGNTFLRAETTSENQYDNIDLIMPKIEKQIIKFKTKRGEKAKKSGAAELQYLFMSGYDDSAGLPKVTKRKAIDLTPMTEDEAIESIELVGHDFFVFSNSDTGFVNIVYKRKDGDYGVIALNY